MDELKYEWKKMLGVAGGLIIVFLVIRYWTNLESFLLLAVSAATPLIIGCVMAYVINILMNCYERWYSKLFQVDVARKIRRVVCLILAFLSLGCIVFLVVNLVVPELVNCIASFIRLIPGALQMMVDFVGEDAIVKYFPQIKEGFDISSQAEQLIKSIIGGVGGAVDSIVSAVSSAVSVVVNVVIGLIFSLYVLIEKESLGAQCRLLIKTYLPKISDKVFYITQVFDESFHRFIVGQCIEAVVLGGLCVAGMLLLRLPYAVMIGVFIGFTALIPIAGAYIGAVVGAVMILTVSPIQALQFLIFVVVLQQVEGNLIYPKVVGQSIGLPGIWVLTAITIGGGVLGVGGMLLAVPIFAAMYRLVRADVSRRNHAPEAENKEVDVMDKSETPEGINVSDQVEIEETDVSDK